MSAQTLIDIDTLINDTDLVQLAERAGAHLRRSGDGYRGACPLHGGDNRSAFVIYIGDDGRQRWHCYTGCKDGGDALDFVMRQRHVNDFVEGTQLLAEATGQPVPYQDPEQAARVRQQRTKRQRRQTLLNAAADYYRRRLQESEEAQSYARGRDFTDEAIRALGYSDGQLHEHLENLDADMFLARELGLIIETTNGHRGDVDAIPGGYLVYVHRHHGRVTYMSGRSIHTDEQSKKARNLRAPRRPYWALQKHNSDTLLIVEGQACAITAWQWGYNAVALCGSSLDDTLLKAIEPYRGRYLILDADISLSDDKLATVADRLGPMTMIVQPPAHDLNAWLLDGSTSEDLGSVLKDTDPWIDIAIQLAVQAPPYALEEHLEHLAGLVVKLAQGTRGKYIYRICTQEKLSTRSDFRRLIEERGAAESDTNGFDVLDGRLCEYGDPLANFGAWITHELIHDDGLNPPEVFYTVAGTLQSGEPLETIELPAEEFERGHWIARSWGARPIVYVSPGKYYLLRRAIQEVSKVDLQRERVYTYTGWAQIAGERRYLTTSGALGATGLDPDTRVDLGLSNISRYALPKPPPDLRQAIRASLDFLTLAPYEITIPLWAAMYAAPLGPIKTLDAVMWVYGTTQSGKSTITHLALTHFGPGFIQGHQYRAPRDWTATVTDLEYALFVTKDMPVVIDDYAPAHAGVHEAKALARKAHRVVRSVGNRSARGRSTANLTERTPRPPRGLVIATAENPLVGQSIVGRMIYIPVEKGAVIPLDGSTKETHLDRAQKTAQAGLYAQAMSGYIAWLADRWDDLTRNAQVQVAAYTRAARAMFPSGQSRLTDYYAILALAIDLALRYAADCGAIEQPEAEPLAEIYRHELIEMLRAQSARVAAESPVIKFWEALQDLLAQERICFAPRLSTGYIKPERATLVGWFDPADAEEPRVYLLTNAALAEAKAYWKRLDESFDVSSDALRRQLRQQGYIARRGSDHYERNTYINKEKGRKRTLWLDPKALQEKAGVALG